MGYDIKQEKPTASKYADRRKPSETEKVKSEAQYTSPWPKTEKTRPCGSQGEY